MLDLNRTERRTLLLGTMLVALGAAVRLGVGPGEAAYSWRPVTGTDSVPDAAAVRRAVRAGVARAAHAARPLAPGERVDPNTAPAVELERLPGVGPARAQAIVDDRGRSGPFASLEELARVPGIGSATLRRLAPYVTLAPRPAERARLPARVASPPGRNRPPGSAGERRPGGRAPVNLNRASAEELQALPGIGPVLAARILHLRASRGRLRAVEELLDVPGIGPRRLEVLRPLVTAP
ncbi:MAG: ComEA family DNA-binding protein [Gemmatimonadota bacterium]